MSEINIECSICKILITDYKDSSLAVVSCGHLFHKSCIEKRMAVNVRSSCPKCKKDVSTITTLKRMEQSQGVKSFKIVVVGDYSCGKTFLIHRFVKNEYVSEGTFSPSNVFCRKLVLIGEEWITLEIWDTVGAKNFRNLAPVYAKDADGVIFAYDSTSKHSMESTLAYRKEIANHCFDHAVKILVGCKIDKCPCSKSVSEETSRRCDCPTFLEREEMAKLLEVQGYQTSAKTGENVEAIFRYLTLQMLQAKFPERFRSMPDYKKKPENKNNEKVQSCVCC